MKTEALKTENGSGSADGGLRRLWPSDFRSLPQSASPAAYICVLRDPNAKAYRIEASEEPKALIDKLIQTGDYRFGIELVALLATDDLAATEAYLEEKHGAALSSDWLIFDEYQIEALNGSVLVEHQRNSFYIFPENRTPAKAPVRRGRDVGRFWSARERDRRRWQRRSELLRDPEINDDEDDVFTQFMTSKPLEIGAKILLAILVLLIYLARHS
ncbi:MAG: hypothetical protein OXG60_15500 [Chloroflexi bacterium]|nr:hypothetical protein [Chloroflexota bacterium]